MTADAPSAWPGLAHLGFGPTAIHRAERWLIAYGAVPMARIPVVAFELVWRACYGEWWTPPPLAHPGPSRPLQEVSHG